MAKKKTIDLRSVDPTPVPAGDGNIIYNGTRIGGFSEDTEATLKTGGTRVLHDINVNYNVPAAPIFEITFSGTTADDNAECDQAWDDIEAAVLSGKMIRAYYQTRQTIDIDNETHIRRYAMYDLIATKETESVPIVLNYITAYLAMPIINERTGYLEGFTYYEAFMQGDDRKTILTSVISISNQ